ncbi:MAG: hypothetical protein JSV49_07135 [Thermoplasmata archaeon]|nr:MAG: hypothetical protein JSV49_07135 [Thermoplasmata archaeon]
MTGKFMKLTMQRLLPKRLRKKRFSYDQRALSSLITVAGILAIIIMVISAVLNTLVPQWAKEDELEHMDNQLRNFLTLRTEINNLIENEDFERSVSPRVSLGASGNIPVGVIPSSGKLTFNPFDNSTDATANRVHDPLSIYSKGGGNIQYEATNYYYQDQTIVYEHGAVLLSQADGSVMKAGPEFSASKVPLLNDTRSFGYFDPGTKEEPSEMNFNFPGRYGNLTLSYDIFDVDTDGEILIKLNRRIVAAALVTGDENWTGPHKIELRGDWIHDLTINTLQFNQTTGIPGEEWGVRNVSLSGNITAVDLTMVTLIGNKEDSSGRDSHTVNAKLIASGLNSFSWPDENITINFTTKYPEAWEAHLNSAMNESTTNLHWDSDSAKSEFMVMSTRISADYYIVSLTIKHVTNFDCTVAILRTNLG